MHEMEVAGNILELIEQEMERHPGAKLVSFEIRVGELSCVQEHSLRFCLEATLKDTPWPEAAIRIVFEPVGARCRACGEAFAPQDYVFLCPKCEGMDVEVTGGKEVCLESLEIDE